MGELIPVVAVILILAMIAFGWSLDRGIVSSAPARLLLRAAIVLMVIFAVLWLIPWAFLLIRPRAAPVLPPSALQFSQHQVYICQIRAVDFEFRGPGSNQPLSISNHQYIDFVRGALLQTGAGESGYACVGLPGRAELFMGPDSQVRLISVNQTSTVLQLDKGRLILNLPEDFTGSRVTVLSAGGATTWLDGSKMCLSYEAASKALHMDCVEDRCGYLDGTEEFVPAGYHVIFDGASVAETGPGLQSEACQFVPGAVPTSTSGPANLTPDATSP